ncbi:MAG: (d)CMP kinase [Pseudomonadota bacterium]
MSAPVPVIAVDGPSGAGKGTVARSVAEILGWHFLDSGALYRVTALAAIAQGLDLADAPRVAEIAAALPVRFARASEGEEQILLNNAEVTRQVRDEKTGEAASRVAALPAVRAALVERQRAFAEAPGLVADGRDMGTAIFPEAAIKIFLTASAEERAARRYKQLKEKNFDVTVVDLLQEIEGRDARDINRADSPLIPAREAIIIDSTGISADDVIAEVLRIKNSVLGPGA